MNPAKKKLYEHKKKTAGRKSHLARHFKLRPQLLADDDEQPDVVQSTRCVETGYERAYELHDAITPPSPYGFQQFLIGGVFF